MSVGAGPDTGTWRRAASAPTARTEVSAATVSGKVYVIGGLVPPSLTNVLDLSITDKVEEYDPAADRWQARASLPAKLHHSAAIAIGEHVYVVGGFRKSLASMWEPVSSVYIYDPQSNSWSNGQPMPTPRGALAAAAVEGKILAIGGHGDSGNTGAVESYDPVARKWETLPPLPTPRDHLAAATVRGRVYAIGGRLGRDYHQNLSIVETYNSITREWARVADLPTPRSGVTAGVIDDIVYVLGGEAPTGTFSLNEAYRPSTDTWTTAMPMPTARHGLGSAVIDRDIYVMAGGPKPGGSYTDVNEVFRPASASAGPSDQNTNKRSRTSSAHVGAVMAMLATLSDADVLPPETSSQANVIIKALIQFQSAFLKSRHPAVREFFAQAQRARFPANDRDAFTAFDQTGWTPATLEALAEQGNQWGDWNATGLADGFREFNVSRQDFDLIVDLFQKAKSQLHARGDDIHQVYTARRRAMPGATF